MSIDYVGEAFVEINGVEFDVVSINVTHNTGRKAVRTMNRKRRAKGTCAGIETWELSVVVAIPEGENSPWAAFKDAKLSVVDQAGKRKTYRDCFSTEISEQYEADSEARRNVSMTALDCIEE